MSNTPKTQAELLAALPDNDEGLITPQDLRDFVVSVPNTVDHSISDFAYTLLDDASASAARSTLGLGTAATQASSAFAAATHASTHASGGSDPVTIAESQVTNLVSDLAGKASTTHASTHASAGSDPVTISESQVTNLVSDLAGKASTTHASTHASAGSDPVSLATSQITTGTMATARLGSGSASATAFLRGDSSWATIGDLTGNTLTDTTNNVVNVGKNTQLNGNNIFMKTSATTTGGGSISMDTGNLYMKASDSIGTGGGNIHMAGGQLQYVNVITDVLNRFMFVSRRMYAGDGSTVVMDLNDSYHPNAKVFFNGGLAMRVPIISGDASPTTIIDVPNRTANDAANAWAIDWANRQLWQSGSPDAHCLDWENCQLWDSANNVPSIDWAYRSINDANSNTVIDYSGNGYSGANVQFDSSGGTILNGGLKAHDGSESINPDVRTLTGTNGLASVDYDNRILKSGTGNNSVDWGSFSLTDNSNNVSCDWNGGNLFRSDNSGALCWKSGDLYGNWNMQGVVSRYNNINTAGNGQPAIRAVVDLTTQSAAITATTLYAVPASGAGQYRVTCYAKVTRAATSSSVLSGNSGFRLYFTDQNDSVSVTIGALPNQSAGAALGDNNTQVVYCGSVMVNCKASTNLQYSFDYTSSGATSMQYNLHIRVEAL